MKRIFMQARVSCPGKLIEQQEEEDEKNTKRHKFFLAFKNHHA